MLSKSVSILHTLSVTNGLSTHLWLCLWASQTQASARSWPVPSGDASEGRWSLEAHPSPDDAAENEPPQFLYLNTKHSHVHFRAAGGLKVHRNDKAPSSTLKSLRCFLLQNDEFDLNGGGVSCMNTERNWDWNVISDDTSSSDIVMFFFKEQLRLKQTLSHLRSNRFNSKQEHS